MKPILLGALLLSAHLTATTQLLTLSTEKAAALADQLIEAGYDVAGYSERLHKVSVVTEFPFLIELLRRDNAITFQIESVLPTESYDQFSAREYNDAEEKYLGPEATLKELQNLAKKYPLNAKVYHLNEMLKTPLTTEGRAIYALHVSSQPEKIEDKPKILIDGQHHARELMTHHAVLDTAKDLLESAAKGNTNSKQIIQNLSVWFVPVINPDGLNHVLTKDRMWRKNRTKNPGGSFGVDLNRNYNVKWGACGQHSDLESSEVFKGAEPDSEAEVRVMEALNHSLHFTYSVSYHSYGNEILRPYLCGTLAEENVYRSVTESLQELLGFGFRFPSSGGEDHEYHYNKLGTIAFLLELGEDFQPPFSIYRNEVWPKVQKILPFFASLARANLVEIRVTDATTQQPVIASLEIKEIPFVEKEERTTDQFGVHRWKLPAANYQLIVRAQGYTDQTISINATESVTQKAVALKRSWGRISLQEIGNWLFSFSG